MTLPLTTTLDPAKLDQAVADMRKVLPQVVAEIERRAIAAAQPAPPTEALRLLRDARALAYPFSKSPEQRQRIVDRIDRYLAATEEGTP